MLEGGSLVGNESANVLSSARSRRFCCVSSSSALRSSGSRPEPGCARSLGVICGLPFTPSLSTAISSSFCNLTPRACCPLRNVLCVVPSRWMQSPYASQVAGQLRESRCLQRLQKRQGCLKRGKRLPSSTVAAASGWLGQYQGHFAHDLVRMNRLLQQFKVEASSLCTLQ